MFPNTIIFKDLKFYPNINENLNVNKAKVDFSIGGLFKQKTFVVKGMSLSDVVMRDDASLSYLRRELIGIVGGVKSKYKNNLNVKIEKGKSYLLKKDGKQVVINLDSQARITSKKLLFDAKLDFNDSLQPYDVNLEASFVGNGLNIKKVSISADVVDVLLWGDLFDDQLRLNGYSMAAFDRPKTADERLSNMDLYLLDIALVSQFLDSKWIIEDMAFTLNNVPVKAQGNLEFLNDIYYDLDLDMDFSDRGIANYNNVDHVALQMKGGFGSGNVFDRGDIKIKLKDQMHQKFPIKEWNVSLSKLRPELFRKNKSFILDQADIKYSLRGESSQMVLKDILINVESSQEFRKDILFSSRFHNGELNGEVRLDKTELGEIILSNIEVKDADTKGIKHLFSEFAQVDALFSGKFYVTNFPNYSFRGDISLDDGNFQDAIFFDWLSDYFSMPSLKRIDFNQLTSTVSFDQQGLHLNKINLKSPILTIDGGFQVDEEKLVSSKFSLGFKRQLLEESPHFRSLVKRNIYKKYDIFDFDFILSGNVDAMNFQWAQSALKSEVKETIPDFYQRRIEDGIKSSISN